MIHIADAPCHGKEYYDGVVRDNHPNGDPEGISHWTMMSELVRRDIQYWFGHIQKDYTKKMIEVFNQSWMQLSQQIFKDLCNAMVCVGERIHKSDPETIIWDRFNLSFLKKKEDPGEERYNILRVRPEYNSNGVFSGH